MNGNAERAHPDSFREWVTMEVLGQEYNSLGKHSSVRP